MMNDSSTQASDDYNIIPTPKREDTNSNYKGMMIVYKECLKNHAAALGAHSTDGCGEFMPSSCDDSLLCSACSCHRNFHRKELDVGGAGHANSPECYYWCNTSIVPKNQVLVCHQNEGAPRARHGPHNIPEISVGPKAAPSENQGEQTKVEVMTISKKRYRTRFTNEQKEKMLGFAEKAGWKIQRLEEGLVQQFCQEIGIKRRVLKVWMHNNKHLFAKKITNSSLDDMHEAS